MEIYILSGRRCQVCDKPSSDITKRNQDMVSTPFMYIHMKCYSPDFKDKCECKNDRYKPDVLFRNWNPKNHLLFPYEVKLEIFTVLCESHRLGSLFQINLSKDTLFLLFEYIATENGRTKINNIDLNTVCTPSKCIKDKNNSGYSKYLPKNKTKRKYPRWISRFRY